MGLPDPHGYSYLPHLWRRTQFTKELILRVASCRWIHMYIYKYIFIYLWYIYICEYIYFLNIYIYIYIYIHKYIYMYIHMWIYIYIHYYTLLYFIKIVCSCNKWLKWISILMSEFRPSPRFSLYAHLHRSRLAGGWVASPGFGIFIP